MQMSRVPRDLFMQVLNSHSSESKLVCFIKTAGRLTRELSDLRKLINQKAENLTVPQPGPK
jgi:hypothetical protein